jgi:hypothetical protein
LRELVVNQCFQVRPPSGETSTFTVERVPSGDNVRTLLMGTCSPAAVVVVVRVVQVLPSGDTVSTDLSLLPSLI